MQEIDKKSKPASTPPQFPAPKQDGDQATREPEKAKGLENSPDRLRIAKLQTLFSGGQLALDVQVDGSEISLERRINPVTKETTSYAISQAWPDFKNPKVVHNYTVERNGRAGFGEEQEYSEDDRPRSKLDPSGCDRLIDSVVTIRNKLPKK